MRPNNKRAQEEKEAEESRKADGEGAAVQKEAPRIVWFKATDKRVPLIAIPIEQAPPDFVTNSEKYANKLFVVSAAGCNFYLGLCGITSSSGCIRVRSRDGLSLLCILSAPWNVKLALSLTLMCKRWVSWPTTTCRLPSFQKRSRVVFRKLQMKSSQKKTGVIWLTCMHSQSIPLARMV